MFQKLVVLFVQIYRSKVVDSFQSECSPVEHGRYGFVCWYFTSKVYSLVEFS